MAALIAKMGNTRYETTLISGAHQWTADEPQPLGTDLGPSPYDFLLAALGSCVAITLRMYADRKQWDLQSVEVHLDQRRVHAKDCEDCASETGYVHLIEKRLKFTGNLSEEQRSRLLEISDKCPVNKTLLNEIRIETSLMA